MNKRHPKRQEEEEQRSTADYYELKTKAVEELAEADESNSPQVSAEERQKYGAKVAKGLPAWLKVHFIKWWFPGAVYWFIMVGLGNLLADLDLLFVMGLVLGMATDLLTNNVLRFFAETPGAYDKWMMFPKKRYMTFFWNILYSFVLMIMVFGLRWAWLAVTRVDPVASFFGREPVTFGLLYVLCDALLIALKHLLARLFKGAANKNV